MSKRTDREFLSDVREAIHRIKAYTVDINYDFFLEDTKTQDAVVQKKLHYPNPQSILTCQAIAFCYTRLRLVTINP